MTDPAEAWSWRKDGLCRFYGPELFFPHDQETRGDRLRRESTAKAICRDCPVKFDCYEHALRRSEEWGVWGGTSEADRRRSRGSRLDQAANY
ncbi:hypothetical protein CH274_10630 [Rhodococcus sp. 06-418-5]|uniref:WhiB family transcriptional regulator n=1 Tax=Rhodococcus sp. 06-418-5 TaxID=2022507 RepID=UPI000B9C2A24|nr:WhiB family transcriptional regulator [Rhodococcus sp. 06-418-5]OZC81284.1 hypothetical protein CH274_10630 [Rhodococcus sp. 06-418-5]